MNNRIYCNRMEFKRKYVYLYSNSKYIYRILKNKFNIIRTSPLSEILYSYNPKDLERIK